MDICRGDARHVVRTRHNFDLRVTGDGREQSRSAGASGGSVQMAGAAGESGRTERSAVRTENGEKEERRGRRAARTESGDSGERRRRRAVLTESLEAVQMESGEGGELH